MRKQILTGLIALATAMPSYSLSRNFFGKNNQTPTEIPVKKQDLYQLITNFKGTDTTIYQDKSFKAVLSNRGSKLISFYGTEADSFKKVFMASPEDAKSLTELSDLLKENEPFDSTVSRLLSDERFYDDNLEEYLNAKQKVFKYQSKLDKESPDKKMISFTENFQTKLENYKCDDRDKKEKLRYCDGILSGRIRNIVFNKNNYEGICRLKGQDTVVVVTNYPITGEYGKSEVFILGQQNSDDKFQKYLSENKFNKDNLFNNKIHLKVQKANVTGNKQAKAVTYFYPVKMNEFSLLKRIIYHIDGTSTDIKFANKEFQKVLESLEECNPEDFKSNRTLR